MTGQPGTAGPRRPNVLVILTDQHRWDCLGVAGNGQVRTPHLDRLAGDAAYFANAFCPHPICTPSRYSLLSGLYPHQHGGRTNRSTLAPGIATFPRALRQAGYLTKAVGKMHFTPTYLDVGFSELELAEQAGDGRLDDDYHRELRDRGLLDLDDLVDQREEFRRRAPPDYWDTFGARPSDLPEEWHSTTWIAERALRALARWSSGGNLLMVGFIKPHHPFDPPEAWAKQYDPAAIVPRPGWTATVAAHDRAYHRGYFPNDALTEGTLKRAMALYYATIGQIDHQVGRMIALLKERGQYENTLIVFASDHGEYLGFHHMLLKNGYPYDPLLRVPLLIKFPGERAGGTVRETMASLIDLAPTILRQAGVEPPPTMRGLDLADPRADRPIVFAEGRPGQLYLARSRTHALLLTRDPATSLFFDLREDPLQLANRFADPASRSLVEDYRRAIADWLLFEAVTPGYLDERAPISQGANVPPPDDDHRRRMLDYFERRLAARPPG